MKFIRARKFELTLIFLTLLVAVMLIIVVNTASASWAEFVTQGVPTLFHNDSAFVYDPIMPLHERDGVLYVPRNFFAQIYEIDVNTPENLREGFYILYKRNNRWISFNASTGRAFTWAGEDITCVIYIIGGVVYVPAKLVAETLGLQWEYNEQHNSFRIRELGARLTFDELLRPHIARIPTTAPETAAEPTTRRPTVPFPPVVTPTTEPPTEPAVSEPTTENPDISVQPTTEPLVRPPTEPEITTEPTTPEDTREVLNYLIFYDGSLSASSSEETEAKISEALDMLREHDMRAVFFLSGQEIAENPGILRRIHASGNGLGIKTGVASQDLRSELESVNDLIYSIIKHKARFYMFDKSSEENFTFYLMGEDGIRRRGYYLLCDRVVDIDGLMREDIQGADEMTEFMKRRGANVFAFDINGSYRYYFDLSAQAAEEKFYINFSHINTANIEDVKRQLRQRNR
jgi:hypothetical protein